MDVQSYTESLTTLSGANIQTILKQITKCKKKDLFR